MISEIVRSKANIDNGAVTKKSNFFHGLFLLASVTLIPAALSHIPLAALAAMLIVTGIRLASPKEFRHTWHIGREQFAVSVATFAVTLMTDLLLGVIFGFALELLIHIVWNRVPFGQLFRARLVASTQGERATIACKSPAIFGNYLSLHSQLHSARANNARAIAVDFSEASVVDHTTMERLHDMKAELQTAGISLDLIGLDRLAPVSDHPLASRRLPTPG
jgi:MFS superfamily sulfate permease-like transporter